MVTVKFSASPTVLIESQATVLTFRFELNQAPPPSGVTVTVKGNVPQSLTQLDLFDLTIRGGNNLIGDFDFSGFDFTIRQRVATIKVPIFQDNQPEGLQTVTYTLQSRAGYQVDSSARTATIQFADNPSQAYQVIRGTSGADVLTGTSGYEILQGLGGNDILRGGGGNDRLIGGAGSDVFGLQRGAGSATIRDFQDGLDRLGLTGGITQSQLTITQSGSNVLIKLGNDALATLIGVNRNQITSADFTNL